VHPAWRRTWAHSEELAQALRKCLLIDTFFYILLLLLLLLPLLLLRLLLLLLLLLLPLLLLHRLRLEVRQQLHVLQVLQPLLVVLVEVVYSHRQAHLDLW
jgi:hypothetical protein